MLTLQTLAYLFFINKKEKLGLCLEKMLIMQKKCVFV